MKHKALDASRIRRSPHRLFPLAVLVFAAAVGFANLSEISERPYGEYAFDNSVSNDFWCTWGWVAPSPAEGASAAVASFDFSGTSSASSSALVPFRREPRKGVLVIVY